MGVAAYNRASAVNRRILSRTLEERNRDVIDRLNSIEKMSDAGKVYCDMQITPLRGVWWISRDERSFGWWYKSLSELMRRWRVVIVGWDNKIRGYLAVPEGGEG